MAVAIYRECPDLYFAWRACLLNVTRCRVLSQARSLMDAKIAEHRRRHIVIVDDNAELSWFFQQILKLHGYEATVFNHPVPALKHVLAQHTDGIICDLQMPGLDDDLFYATVERAQPALAQRFIFVTGMVDEDRFQTFTKTVEAPVLRKPVPVEKLLEEIARLTR